MGHFVEEGAFGKALLVPQRTGRASSEEGRELRWREG